MLGSEYHFIIIGTYKNGPITAEPYRTKDTSLHARRSYFAPIKATKTGGFGGGAGYRPRVRTAYYMLVYRHIWRTSPLNIASLDVNLKSGLEI